MRTWITLLKQMTLETKQALTEKVHQKIKELSPSERCIFTGINNRMAMRYIQHRATRRKLPGLQYLVGLHLLNKEQYGTGSYWMRRSMNLSYAPALAFADLLALGDGVLLASDIYRVRDLDYKRPPVIVKAESFEEAIHKGLLGRFLKVKEETYCFKSYGKVTAKTFRTYNKKGPGPNYSVERVETK